MPDSSSSIFNSKSGNAVIVAFDYGTNGTVHQEAKNPGATMEKFMSAQPDGVLSSPVLIHRFANLYEKYPSVTPVASLDAIARTPAIFGPMQMFSLDYAVQLGAKAVKCLLISGQTDSKFFLENMQYVAKVGEQAHNKGVPFIVEAVNWGPEILPDKKNDPEELHKVCRMAFDLGADMIKTEYTPDAESFKEISSCLQVPLMILGGSKGDLKDIFQRVREALDAGAKGVVFGRNVYKAESPAKMVQTLKALVHDGLTPTEAIEVMNK